MSVSIVMPGKGDEKIDPKSIFVVREASNYEREENPSFVTCIWGGGFKVYSIDSLDDVVKKLDILKLARLTAPNGQLIIVSIERVTDRDDPLKDQDSELVKSVLAFGPGATAPRTRVRETRNDLIQIWTKAGVGIEPFS